MMLPVGAVTKFRPLVLPGAVFIATSVCLGAAVWCYMSDYHFKLVGRKAQFPYPGVSNGFYMYVTSGILTAVAGSMTWPDFSGKAPKESEGLADQADAASEEEDGS